MIAPTITDVLKARAFLQKRVRHTPLEYSWPLSEKAGAPVYVKWENQQICGSFKIRGALNKMFSLSPEERERGVVTASSGNHAQGVAVAAKMLGCSAVICVPGMCPETKQQAIQRRGGEWVELKVVGRMYDEAEEEALRLAREEGRTYVSAYEDLQIAAGQGTLGFEMLLDEPDLEVLVVPISGGGLISGITAAARALSPDIEIWGVHAEANPSWTEGWKAGKIVPVEEEETLADALCGAASQENYEFLRPRLAGVVSVPEEHIKEAMAFFHREHHQVIEGGAAVAGAALLHRRIPLKGRKTGIVLSGGNAPEKALVEILQKY